MLHRFKTVLLPVIIIMFITLGTVNIVALSLESFYREDTNHEAAQLLGALISEEPDVDTAKIIQAIKIPNTDVEALGREILQEYGYLSSDIVTPSARNFCFKMSMLLSCGIVSFAIIVLLYFWHRDWLEERKIKRLVAYLQNLKERVYNLRLNENSEDELSLLSNEIYKITVLLKESAENNRLHSQNLETAMADISHQLRTPLTSLQVTIDNIYDDPDMSIDIRQDFLRSASRQIESMSSLVMTLLNLAKFDNDSIKLHDQPMAAGELLEEVRQNLGILSELQGVTVKLEGKLDTIIKIDPRWQREALANIIKNCIEHSKYGGEVIISVEDCPLYSKFTIKDNGDGIASEDLHHIFERFYKAKNSSSESIGIGLAFAKAIVEADNGQISVKSQIGEGTTFSIKYFK